MPFRGTPFREMTGRVVQLVVEYDGSGFAGWQSQPEERTVQGELQRAVETMVRHPVEVSGAGRTDRGVHATGQSATFETTTAIPASSFASGLNRYLPPDVAVISASERPEGFHARFSAVGKHYRYLVRVARTRRVFIERRACRVPPPIDVGAMREAATALVGEHDFAAFATRSKDAPETTVRTVHAVTVRERPPLVVIDVVGRGFLYTMVRTIAGTLLEVGRGRRAASDVAAVLASRDRRRAGPTGEARGLCLCAVFYDQTELDEAVERVSRPRLDGETFV